MPRINAPTLAQHRAERRATLLAAASDLLETGGPAAVTMAAIAAAAGLSRPAVYEYFDSVPDLLLTLVEDGWANWHRTIRDRVDLATDATSVVTEYVGVALKFMAADGHRLASLLSEVTWPAELAERLASSHRDAVSPLAEALARVGVPEAEATAELAQAVVEAATRRVLAGADPVAEIARASALLRSGIAAE